MSSRVAVGARRWVEEWWGGRAGPVGTGLDALLWPVERLYAGAVRLRNAGYDRHLLSSEAATIRVLSIGNLSVGGAGKTPVAAWAAAYLAARGARPALVLRGYGGDEVLVHRELNPTIPVFVAPRRIAGVRAAQNSGCTIAILDDGFQHRSLRRDLDLLLIAAESWPGTRLRLLPRGPWREPIRAAARADQIVITRKSATSKEAEAVRADVQDRLGRMPVTICELRAMVIRSLWGGGTQALASLRGSRALAVAGLAAPEPFARQLAEQGIEAELSAFPDHHRYSRDDVERIVMRAAGRPIVTTMKDVVKLRHMLPRETPTYVLLQDVRPETGLERALDGILTLARVEA